MKKKVVRLGKYLYSEVFFFLFTYLFVFVICYIREIIEDRKEYINLVAKRNENLKNKIKLTDDELIEDLIFSNFDRLEIKNKGKQKMYAKIYLKNGFLIRPIGLEIRDVLDIPFINDNVKEQLLSYIVCEIYIKKQDDKNYLLIIKDINGNVITKDCTYNNFTFK